jgi:hypothetical protein
MGSGFCDNTDNILEDLSNELRIPCIKGTAHLPNGYTPEEFK